MVGEILVWHVRVKEMVGSMESQLVGHMIFIYL